MASLESLPADQRAVLQLLLKQGKSYEDLSGLLRIDTTAVRERAHDAVASLGPEGAGVGADRRTRSPTTCSASSPPPSARRRASTSRARPPAAPGRARQPGP